MKYKIEPKSDIIRDHIFSVSEIRRNMPPLPEELFEKFTKKYGLSKYDASTLIDDKEFALYYERMVGNI